MRDKCGAGAGEDDEFVFCYFHGFGHYSDGDDAETVAIVESSINGQLVEVSPPLVQFTTDYKADDKSILKDILTELQYMNQILTTEVKIRIV